MVSSKQKGKKIPGFSVGVRENSAIRMVKLVRPICPNSQKDMTVTPEGRLVPKRGAAGPDRQNCQEMGKGWWEECEARGHNPYFSDRAFIETVEVEDPDTGELRTKRVKHSGENCTQCGQSHLHPNVVQVAANMRINSGQGPKFKIDNHGFKRLGAFGYDEVCQYRNCQRPITVSSRVGLYCGRQHAALVGADIQNIPLVQITGRFEAGLEMEAAQRRSRGLIEAAQFIDIKDIPTE